MPKFRISIANRHFSDSEEVEVLNLEAARSQALKGALQIGTDEVCGGNSFFAAEVKVESGQETVERLMIAIGTSSLQ